MLSCSCISETSLVHAGREEFDSLAKDGPRVVVDLQFDDLMSEREVKSLVVQVCIMMSCLDFLGARIGLF
jgi:hypothetical protein